MENFLRVGKIINTHGVKGELKILPLTDNPDRYNKLKKVYIERDKTLQMLTLSGVRYFKDSIIVKFNEINDLDMAEDYKGHYILIDRKDAIKLPKDSYFIADILGCGVYEENGSKLGIITDILETGSNDVYIVKNENGKEILIPALKAIIKEVSINDKKIIASLPKGLVDDEI